MAQRRQCVLGRNAARQEISKALQKQEPCDAPCRAKAVYGPAALCVAKAERGVAGRRVAILAAKASPCEALAEHGKVRA